MLCLFNKNLYFVRIRFKEDEIEREKVYNKNNIRIFLRILCKILFFLNSMIVFDFFIIVLIC